MDRQVLGVLKTTLQHNFDWSEIDYGNLVFAFQAAYATGLLCVGWLVDRLGTRVGYALAMVFWSLASMAHAFAGSFSSFIALRCALGFGESALFPASLKAVAEWFPKKERSLATGIFNAGTNLGAMITPLTVPWITIHWGWRWAFVMTGAIGFLWLVFWLILYRKPEEHSLVSPEELSYIRSGREESTGKIPWLSILPHRQTWAFVTGKFMIDPVWWFYLFWVPDYFQRQHGLSLMGIGLPVMMVYLLSDLGSITGGWFSTWLIGRGKSVNFARKTAMLACAICVLPITLAYRAESTWTAVLLIGLAAAGHQGFSTNLLTLTSDLFPARAVGSVAGLGGMAGAAGGMVIAKLIGHLLQSTGSYMIPFLLAGIAYFLALGCVQILSPRLEPADIKLAGLQAGGGSA